MKNIKNESHLQLCEMEKLYFCTTKLKPTPNEDKNFTTFHALRTLC